MAVPSISFLILVFVAAILFNLSSAPRWRQLVLLVTNIYFLSTFVHAPAELIPYVGFLGLGFALIHMVRRGVPTMAYAVSIGVLLFSFFWLKKYTFLPSAIFIGSPYLLVGMSYVFFRVMHLLIDARYPEDAYRLTIVDYVNYTLNFTSVTSGPIQRYEEYFRMTTSEAWGLGPLDIGVGVERILIGLCKIMVLAVFVSIVQQRLAYHLTPNSGMLDRVGTVMALTALYPIYLYFNFSGYTDFVIGAGRFFRIKLPENFERPFTATSFIEYWNRWHMSLSNWLKSYVYTPLVTSLARHVRNPDLLPYMSAVGLFATFFLIGAWHGRTANFLFFGLLNGAGVALNQGYRIVMMKRLGRKGYAALGNTGWYSFICRGLTFTWIAFTLLWFWSDWVELGRFAAMLGPVAIAAGLGALVIAAAAALHVLMRIHDRSLAPEWRDRPVLNSRYVRTAWMSVMLLVVLVVQGVMDAGPPGIVYKDF